MWEKSNIYILKKKKKCMSMYKFKIIHYLITNFEYFVLYFS